MNSGLLHYEEAAARVAAYAKLLAANRSLRQPGAECVELSRSYGRVLASALFADRDLPPFARSTRDGFACRAQDACSHAPLAIAGTTRAGQAPSGPLPAGAAWEIMTGAPVPAGANAVLMVEHVEVADGSVQLVPPRLATAGENIVPQGAEARCGDELLPAGSVVEAPQIALAASCGYSAVDVYPKPRVAILATGDELVPVESMPGPGQIRNSNGSMLAAMVAAAGGEPWVLPVAADENEALEALLEESSQADLLLITGGVSAGKFDLVEPALERAGAKFHFTGVLMQPGKPVVFGDLPMRRADEGNDARMPFFGLPGNPISSAVTFLLFAAPVLDALAGQRKFGPRFALAQLAADAKHTPGLTRFLPAFCNFSPTGNGLPEVALVPWQGSGDLAAMAHSNCFMILPEDATEFKAGEMMRILFR